MNKVNICIHNYHTQASTSHNSTHMANLLLRRSLMMVYLERKMSIKNISSTRKGRRKVLLIRCTKNQWQCYRPCICTVHQLQYYCRDDSCQWEKSFVTGRTLISKCAPHYLIIFITISQSVLVHVNSDDSWLIGWATVKRCIIALWFVEKQTVNSAKVW